MWSRNNSIFCNSISKPKPPFIIEPISYLAGKIIMPADKSISHRALIISSISKGVTEIENFLDSQDTLSTLAALKAMGVRIKQKLEVNGRRSVVVYGRGLLGLRPPKVPIYVGNSGTTLRLLLGVLAGCSFRSRLRAGDSLSFRPMLRVTEPLRLMGAKIKSRVKYSVNKTYEEYAPITIEGRNRLKPISYRLSIPSAQVKSAVLLAGLYAEGISKVNEPKLTRDHTERMLKIFKAKIKVKGPNIKIEGLQSLISPGKIIIPGDISSAAFFIVGASILRGSEIIIKSVSLNSRRIGIIRVLRRMGADIKVTNQKSKIRSNEPQGDITVKGSELRGTIVKEEEIPSLIDELPILMVAASFAKGKTEIYGVSELRVKETDRINSMLINLRKMGLDITHKKENEVVVIRGANNSLKGAKLKSFRDHRTAMSLIIAALAAKGKSEIDDIDCINKSFPKFLDILFQIRF